MEKYIGLDAHSTSCTFVTLDHLGREISQGLVATSETEIKKYVRNIEGKKVLTFEESTMARWLFALLKNEVDNLVVCNPMYVSKKRGAKTDYLDAKHLASELRAGNLVGVFHEEGNKFLELRILVSSYLDINEDIVRAKNRLKALFRSEALNTKGKKIFYNPERVNELSSEVKQISAESFMSQINNLEDSKKRYLNLFAENLKKFSLMRQLDTIPGIDIVRANIIAAIICDGARFKSKHELWSYASLVRHKQISNGVSYGNKMSFGRGELKAAFVGTAESVLKTNSSLRKYYDRLRSQGFDHRKAKKALARKIAAICLTVMKTGKPYDDHFEEKKTGLKNQLS